MEFNDHLKNFDENKQNETVTSSKFVLNHRDKHNIVDFLSANHSDGENAVK